MRQQSCFMRARWSSLVLALGAALAPQVSAAPAVTVYSNDLGFVRETRALDFSGGRDTLEIGALPRRLDFASLQLALAAGKVTRFARRFDVASGDAVLDVALGKAVRAELRGERTVEGTLLSADGAWLVLQARDGSLHTLARGAVDDLRVLEAAPPFTLRPTVEVVVEGARRGRAETGLAYLTGGLSWSAEHSVVRRGETRAEWSAAVTVDNQSGLDYANAKLKLVAGDPNRAAPPPMPYMKGRVAMALETASADGGLVEESFAEYHLYTLDRPATLRDQESQKLTLLDPREVKVKTRYLYNGRGTQVLVQLQAVNDKAAGLGEPLPAGRVRVYEADASGDLQFTGEARLGHIAAGEELTVDVGTAFDVVAERRELYQRRISDREREYAVEIELRNRKTSAVEIVVHENVSGDIEVLKQTHEFKRKDVNTLEFVVPVAAGKSVTVSYTVRVRY